MRHTPEPWSAHYDQSNEVFDISNSTPNECGELEKIIATVWSNRPSLKETAEYDARLIAEAPELLAAVVELLKELEGRQIFGGLSRTKNAVARVIGPKEE